MKRLLLLMLLAVAVLIGVVVTRALTLESKQIEAAPAPALAIDKSAAVQRFARAIQIRTVSSEPQSFEREAFLAWLAQTFPRTIVAPFLVVGATDARWFAGLTPNVYRFTPITLTEKDLARVHGIDERASIDGYLNAIRFYRTLILNMGG